MIGFIVSAIKIIFLLGFLIFIHEGGHFLVAKLCKVKVNDFSIGFGPIIWKKQTTETKYALRLIPLGGFVNMEGEAEESDDEKSFSKASILKRIAIVIAGPLVNIFFGLIVYFILISIMVGIYSNGEISGFSNQILYGLNETGKFALSMGESIKQLFSGKVNADQMMGPVGISSVVASTSKMVDYIYILSVISVSLGVTNLLPIPALDGGKILLLLIEGVRRKPLKQETEIQIQLIGFSILMALSIYITFNDVTRIIK